MREAHLIERIERALGSIRDYLQSDGGDVKVHQVRPDGVVEVELLGNCESCSMSSITMKAGIEQAIFKVAPEVKGVIAVSPS
ncbi:MAG: NifU family protein [Bacteroidota bacterium]